MVESGDGFQLVLAEHDDPSYRDRVIEYLEANWTGVTFSHLDAARLGDFSELESTLAALARESGNHPFPLPRRQLGKQLT